MKKTVKTIAAVLSAVMMLLALCSCKNTSYICTVDGVEQPSGPYAFYAHYTRDKYQAQLAAYGQADFAAALVSNADESGTKLYSYINEETRSSYISHLIVNLKFNEFGLKLTEEQETAIDEAVKANWVDSYGEAKFTDVCRTLGLSASEFEEMVSVSFKYESIMDYLFGEGGQYEITEDELHNKFDENYARFRYIAVSKVNTETKENLTTDELIAKKALIDAAYSRALAGEDFGALMEEYSEDYIKITDDMSDEDKAKYEESNAVSRDQGLVTDKDGIFDYNYYYYYGYTIDSNIVNKVFTMADGEIAMVELSSSFWIVEKLDKNEDPMYYESKRDLIYNSISSPIVAEEFAKWEDSYAIVWNESTVNKYDPRKIEPLFYSAE